ncbi:MAG: hypothetical protein ACREWE_09175, partial [Gammaproteobacteria bacterium]
MPQERAVLRVPAYPSRTVELRLLEAHGSQLAYRQTEFKAIAFSRQQGLFDLRDYLRHYVEAGKEAASIAEIGVCIAEKVLGEEIFRVLAASGSQRTLRIQGSVSRSCPSLPGARRAHHVLCLRWRPSGASVI